MTTTVMDRPQPGRAIRALTMLFRRCEVTGLFLHRPAELLIKANAVAATWRC
jgi:hypothetical protein